MTTKWFLIGTGIGLVILLAFGVGLRFLLMHQAEQDLERAQVRWREVGGVEHLRELKPAPVPDAENAAVVYQQAYEAMQRGEDTGEIDYFDDPYDLDLLRDMVVRYHESLQLAHEAAALPQCQWKTSLYEEDSTLEVMLPHISRMRSLGKIVGGDMLVQADSGNYVAAMRDCETLLRMAAHARAEPLMIQQVVGMALEALAFDRLERAFRDAELPPNNLAALISALDDRDTGRQAYLVEGTSIFQTVMSDDPALDEFMDRPSRVARARGIAEYLEVMSEMVKLADLPFHEVAPKLASTELREDNPFWGFVPSMGRFLEQAAQSEAHRAIVLEAIKLRAYRHEHGSYPDTWTMPLDAVTGEPLIFEKTETGFRLSRPDADPDDIASWEWH